MFNSEEDIKNKIVVPFLKDIGFDSSELSFERSFNFTIGKHAIKIDTKKQIEKASPRYDILIKRNNKNLCIFEIKNDKTSITPKDIDQAVSYARLLDQIAPVCIITNGKEWQIVDSITKKSLERMKLGKYEIALPSDSYYEALREFFGYSENNILEFCKTQISSHMVSLKGSKDDRDKKYIEELYSPSAQLENRFKEFMQSGSQCFVAVGDSGSGKTCWICNTAEQFILNGYPVFFYRAGDISKNILSTMIEDLSWELSPALNEQQGLKRILQIFQKKQSVPIMIFVDGLDEIKVEFARDILDSLLRRIDGKNVRFVATCKSFSWDKLLVRDGTPTLLSLSIFKVDNNPGYFISRLEDQQFFTMIKKYRNFYGFKGMIESKVLDDCKINPYLLRVMFEVSSQKKLTHITYNALGFFDEYFNSIICRFDNTESVQATIFSIAKLIYEIGENYIDIGTIRSKLAIPLTGQIDERLFELNILEKQEQNGVLLIGFYFKKFRDYIIAFKILRLHLLTVEQLKAKVSELFYGKLEVKRDVRNLYYTLCREEHKRVFDQPIYDKAIEYVSQYEKIIDNQFFIIKDRFPPFAKKAIGLFAYTDSLINCIIAFGYRAIDKDDPKVIFFPIGTSFFSIGDHNLPVIYGTNALQFRYSLKEFDKTVFEKDIFENEIIKQLKIIIKNGLLYEGGCIYLIAERLVAQYFQYYRNLLYQKKPLSSNFPLKLNEMRRVILYERAYRIISDSLIQEKIDSGEIKTYSKGKYSTYAFSLSQSDKEKISIKARKIAEEGEFLESDTKYMDHDKMEKELLSEITLLENNHYSQIEAFYPLDWYDGIENHIEISDKINEFLSKLLVLALDAYQVLIKENFGSFQEKFQLFKKMPIKCFWVFAPGMHLSDLYFCYANDETINSGVVCKQNEINFGNWTVSYKGLVYKCFLLKRMGLLDAQCYYLPYKVNGQLVLLRNLVYELIMDEFPKPFS